MNLKKGKWILVPVAASALALFAASCTKKESAAPSGQAASAPVSDTLKVGEVGSMTGAQATFGMSTHNGIDLAIRQINAAGGVKGKKLEVVTVDDQGKPEEAATATTKLITQDKVIAVLGEVASSNSLAMAPIAQQYGVPMITPSSTNPAVTAQGNFIFRVCFIDPFQGQVMAKFASNNLKATKVAILRDIKSDYSMGLADYFIQEFKKGGGAIVVDTSYSQGDQDFKAQLTSIGNKADAIFVPGYYTDIGLIAKQARELGIQAPLLGGDGWDSPKLKEIGGAAIDGSYFSNHYSNEDKAPQIQDFITEFKKSFNVMPDGLSAMGYDAAKVLADAMGRAKSLSTADIRDAIAATKDYQGVTGKITINEKRDAVKSAVVLKIVNGEYKYQTTINP